MMLSLTMFAAMLGLQAAPCPIPDQWGPIEAAPMADDANVVTERGGVLTWNGTPIDQQTLRQYLQIVGTLRPQPAIIVDTRSVATCARVGELQHLIGSLVPCDPGLCRSGLLTDRRAPPPPPAPSGRQVDPRD